MDIKDLFRFLKPSELVKLQYLKIKKNQKKEIKFKNNFIKNKLSQIYPVYEKEKINFEIFAGIIVSELNKNNFDSIITLPNFLIQSEDPLVIDINQNNAQFIKNYIDSNYNKIIITYLIPNSISRKLDLLKPGDEIIKVNNVTTNDIKSYRKALQKSLKN